MSNFSKLKAGVGPVAMGFALVASPAFGQDAPQAAAPADAPAPADAIVVTGSRIATPNLVSTSPVTAVTAEEIKTVGTTKVEDLVNSLPQVFAGQGSNYSNGSTGTSTLNLRGLGSTRTLVLVNGRRLVPGDPSSSAADVNMIPSSMVKRVDVLTGGASSVYGADAVAGVINFVLDTKFDGFRVDSSYGFYNHDNRAGSNIVNALNARKFPNPTGSSNGGGTFDTTVSFGAGFDDGHGHITAYMGYRRTNAVLQADRDYSACALAASSSAAVKGGALPFTCGGSLTSNTGSFIVNVPDGAGGVTSTIFQVGANRTLTRGSTRYNFGPLNYFQRPDQRYTAGLFADYEISPALHPYMEFMFMNDRTVAQIAPSGDFGNTLSLNCDNPLLSAQQKAIVCSSVNLLVSANPARAFDVTGNTPGSSAFLFSDATTGNYTKGFAQILRRNVEGGGRQDDLEHTEFRGVLGMKGDINKAFSYDVYYQYGRTNYAETYLNDFSVQRITKALDVVTNPATGAPVCRSVLNGTDPNCVPWDIFTPGGVSQAALAYLQTPGFKRGINTENVVSGFINGNLGEYGLKSPFASDGINLVLGGEYRRETLDLLVDTEFSTGDLAGQGGATLPVSGKFSVSEFFAEAQIPLVQDSFIKSMSINPGYRHSSYRVGGGAKFSTDTYKIEGEITPVADIKFRAGYNRAVRAPTLQDFFAPQNVSLDGSTDPCAGRVLTAADAGCLAQGLRVGQMVTPNPAGQYNGLQGGNPNLNPEIADTYSVGAVIQPRFVPGLSMSADYFNIKVKNAIQGIGADTILANCTGPSTTFFCNLIHRDASGSLWRTNDGFVIDTTQNIGGLSTKGFDFSANYSYRLGKVGRISLAFVGTYLKNLISDTGVGATPRYDCAGLYGAVCGTPNPKWRHQVRLGFDMPNGLGFSGRWRHFAGVFQDTTSTNPNLAGPVQPANFRIPSVDYFDLAMTARIGDHYTFRIGANNILDKSPPSVGTPACPTGPCNGNTFAQVYDSLGRYIYTGITLDF